ncbi:CAP domain-containing protein [Pasteuria penetrans]|uniref:CAP domain-containing protein n=1 Tax=Pasteuria penetrans TaxID=86005 RepID=UPI000F936EE2|nr:hypothetical protein [Pasteuria penetrans]
MQQGYNHPSRVRPSRAPCCNQGITSFFHTPLPQRSHQGAVRRYHLGPVRDGRTVSSLVAFVPDPHQTIMFNTQPGASYSRICVGNQEPKIAEDILLENGVFHKINEFRQQNGLGSLILHNKGQHVARCKTLHMAENQYFHHHWSIPLTDGSVVERNSFDMLIDLQIVFKRVDELLLVSARDAHAEQVTASWIQNEDSKKSLLHVEHSHMSIGFARGSYQGSDVFYWSQMLFQFR